jgi:hypothetical protein
MGDAAVLYFVAHSFVSPLVASASNAVAPSSVLVKIPIGLSLQS